MSLRYNYDDEDEHIGKEEAFMQASSPNDGCYDNKEDDDMSPFNNTCLPPSDDPLRTPKPSRSGATPVVVAASNNHNSIHPISNVLLSSTPGPNHKGQRRYTPRRYPHHDQQQQSSSPLPNQHHHFSPQRGAIIGGGGSGGITTTAASNNTSSSYQETLPTMSELRTVHNASTLLTTPRRENNNNRRNQNGLGSGDNIDDGEDGNDSENSSTFQPEDLLCCWNCRSTAHTQSDCPLPPQCYTCLGSGHNAYQCVKNPGPESALFFRGVYCKNCSDEGHATQYCKAEGGRLYGVTGASFIPEHTYPQTLILSGRGDTDRVRSTTSTQSGVPSATSTSSHHHLSLQEARKVIMRLRGKPPLSSSSFDAHTSDVELLNIGMELLSKQQQSNFGEMHASSGYSHTSSPFGESSSVYYNDSNNAFSTSPSPPPSQKLPPQSGGSHLHHQSVSTQQLSHAIEALHSAAAASLSQNVSMVASSLRNNNNNNNHGGSRQSATTSSSAAIANDAGATGNASNILSELKLHNTLNIPIHFNGDTSVYLRRPPSSNSASNATTKRTIVDAATSSSQQQNQRGVDGEEDDDEIEVVSGTSTPRHLSDSKSRNVSMAAMGIQPFAGNGEVDPTTGLPLDIINQQQKNGGGASAPPLKKRVPSLPTTNLITTHVHDVTRHHRCLPKDELARRSRLRDEKTVADADRLRRQQLALHRAQRRQQRLTGFALNQNKYAPVEGVGVASKVTTVLREAETDVEYGHYHQAAQQARAARNNSTSHATTNNNNNNSTAIGSEVDEDDEDDGVSSTTAIINNTNIAPSSSVATPAATATRAATSTNKVRFSTNIEGGLIGTQQQQHDSPVSVMRGGGSGSREEIRNSVSQDGGSNVISPRLSVSEQSSSSRRPSASATPQPSPHRHNSHHNCSAAPSSSPTPATKAVVVPQQHQQQQQRNPFPFMNIPGLSTKHNNKSPTASSAGDSLFPRRPTTTGGTSVTSTSRGRHGSRSHRQQELWRHVWLNYLDEDGNDVRHSAFVIPRCSNTLLTKRDVTDRILDVWGSDFSRDNQRRLLATSSNANKHYSKSTTASQYSSSDKNSNNKAVSATAINGRFIAMMAATDGSFHQLKASGQAFTDWESAATQRRQLLGERMLHEDVVSNGAASNFPSASNFESARFGAESSEASIVGGGVSGVSNPPLHWTTLIHDMAVVFDNQAKMKEEAEEEKEQKRLQEEESKRLANNNGEQNAVEPMSPDGVADTTQVFLTALADSEKPPHPRHPHPPPPNIHRNTIAGDSYNDYGNNEGAGGGQHAPQPQPKRTMEDMMNAWGNDNSSSSTTTATSSSSSTSVASNTNNNNISTMGLFGNASLFYAQSSRRDYARLGQVPLVVPRAVLGKSAPPQSSSSLAAVVAMDTAQKQQCGGGASQKQKHINDGGEGRSASGIRKWEISKAANLPETEKDTFADTLFSNPAEDDDWVVVPTKKRPEDADTDPKSANAKLLAAIATKDQEMVLKKQRLDTIGHAAFTLPAKSSKETATHLIREMQMNTETKSHVAVVQQINALESVLERRGKKLPVKMQLRKAHMEAEYYDHLATGKPAASQQKGSVRGAGMGGSGNHNNTGASPSSSINSTASNRASLMRTEHRVSYTPHELQAVNIGPRANPNIVSRWRLRHLNSKLEAEKTMSDIVRQRDAHRAVVTGTKGVIGSLSQKLSSTPSDLLLSRQQQENPKSPRNQTASAATLGSSTSPRSMLSSSHNPRPPSTRPSTGLRTLSSQSARESTTTGTSSATGKHHQHNPRPMSAREFVRSQSRTALTESARRQPVIGARIDNIWTQECRELAAEAAGDLLRAQVRLRILSFLKRKWWTDRQHDLRFDVPIGGNDENYGDTPTPVNSAATGVVYKSNDKPPNTAATTTDDNVPFALSASREDDGYTNNKEDIVFVVGGGGSTTGGDDDDDRLLSGITTPISTTPHHPTYNTNILGGADSATSGVTVNTSASSPSHREQADININTTVFRTPSEIRAEEELEKIKKQKKEASAAQAKLHSDVALEVYREFEASEFPTQVEERELFYTLLPLAVSSTEAQMLLIGMFEALTITSADLAASTTNAEDSAAGKNNHTEQNPASYTTTSPSSSSKKRNQYGWKLPTSHKSGMRSLEDLQELVSDCCREWVHNAPKSSSSLGGDFSKSIHHYHIPSSSPLRNGIGAAAQRVPSTASGGSNYFFSNSNNTHLLELQEEEDELLLPCTSEGKP